MMSHNDPRVVQQLINDRQQHLREDAARGHQPSTLRVAAGIALIRLGETLRGRSPASLPEMLPPVTGPSLRRLRAA